MNPSAPQRAHTAARALNVLALVLMGSGSSACSARMGGATASSTSWHPFVQEEGSEDAIVDAVAARGEVTEVSVEQGLTRGRFGPYEVTVEHMPGTKTTTINCKVVGTWTEPPAEGGSFRLNSRGLTYRRDSITPKRCVEIIDDEISKRRKSSWPLARR